MLGDLLEIQIDPQPGRLWYLYVAVDDLYRVRDDVLLPRPVKLVENHRMKKLGSDAFSCTHAAEQIGPCALCGAIMP